MEFLGVLPDHRDLWDTPGVISLNWPLMVAGTLGFPLVDLGAPIIRLSEMVKFGSGEGMTLVLIILLVLSYTSINRGSFSTLNI